MLWSCGVQFFIAFLVIRFLKENISADFGFFQFAVIFNGSRSDVDIDSADSSVLMLDGINRFYAVDDVVNRIVYMSDGIFNMEYLI